MKLRTRILIDARALIEEEKNWTRAMLQETRQYSLVGALYEAGNILDPQPDFLRGLLGIENDERGPTLHDKPIAKGFIEAIILVSRIIKDDLKIRAKLGTPIGSEPWIDDWIEAFNSQSNHNEVIALIDEAIVASELGS